MGMPFTGKYSHSFSPKSVTWEVLTLLINSAFFSHLHIYTCIMHLLLLNAHYSFSNQMRKLYTPEEVILENERHTQGSEETWCCLFSRCDSFMKKRT